jgi:hypothetical protein
LRVLIGGTLINNRFINGSIPEDLSEEYFKKLFCGFQDFHDSQPFRIGKLILDTKLDYENDKNIINSDYSIKSDYEQWFSYCLKCFKQYKNSPYLFRTLIYISRFIEIDKGTENLLIKKSNSNLLELRKIIRNRKEETIEKQKEYIDIMGESAGFIMARESIWKGIKPLLIAFRSLDLQVLKNNLSIICSYDYPQKNQNIPEDIRNYINLPDKILNIFQSINYYAAEEEGITLRREFAKDLAEKLKPRDKNDPRLEPPKPPDNYPEKLLDCWDTTLKEPHPVWRIAYIEAISVLGVNPLVNPVNKTNLHIILRKVSESDKSQNVRETARECAEKISKLRTGVDSGSNKRFLVNAFLHLKKAHYLTNKKECDFFDEKEAQKTNSYEVRGGDKTFFIYR